MYSHDHSFLQLYSPGIFWSNRWVGPSIVVAIHRVAWRRDSWWDPPMVEVRWQHVCMGHQPNADRGISKLTILISVRRNWVTATSLHTLKECLSSSLPLIAWAAHKQSWLQWEVTSSSVTTVCVDLKMYRLSNRSVTYPISYKKCTTTIGQLKFVSPGRLKNAPVQSKPSTSTHSQTNKHLHWADGGKSFLQLT